MARSFHSTFICLTGLLTLLLMLVPVGQAEARDGWAGESFDRPSARTRATEALNPAQRGVGVVRSTDGRHQAYAYEVNGQRRVSVAEPRRIEHRRVRLPRQADRLNAIERATAEQAGRYNRHSEQAEPVLQEVARYAYPQANASAPAVTPRATQALHTTTPAVSTARHRAEQAVRQASHRRDVRPRHDVYLGYHHRPVSRSTASVQIYTRPSIHRHHYHSREIYGYNPHTRIHHQSYYHHKPQPYYHPHRSRISTSIGFHHSRSRYHCPPVRHHKHKSRSRASVSIHLDF